MNRPTNAVFSIAEHREGFRGPLRGDSERSHEVGAFCDQVTPAGDTYRFKFI